MKTFALGFALALCVIHPALAESTHHYAIPPQGLIEAVESWGKVTHVSSNIPGRDGMYPPSHGVEGDFEPEQALCILLQGTGVTFIREAETDYWFQTERIAKTMGLPLLAKQCSSYPLFGVAHRSTLADAVSTAHMPHGPLNEALFDWGWLNRINVTWDSTLKFPIIQAMPYIPGDNTPEQVLCAMLKGSGLTFWHQLAEDQALDTYVIVEETFAKAEGVPLLLDRCGNPLRNNSVRNSAQLSQDPDVIARIREICQAQEPERADLANDFLENTGIQLVDAFDTSHPLNDRFRTIGPTFRISDCGTKK